MTAMELEALGAAQCTFGALEMCHCRARGICKKACVCHYRLNTRQNLSHLPKHTLSLDHTTDCKSQAPFS